MDSPLTRTTRVTMLLAAAFMVTAAICVLGPLVGKAYAAEVNFDDLSAKTWVVSPVRSENITGTKAIDFVGANGEWLDEVTITNAKSSNKKVARVEADDSGLWIYYGYKIGKTTISCTVNGVPLSHTFQVKYTCPVSTFKVNGTSVLKQFKKKNFVTTKKTFKNKKVTIKAKKGWVITNATLVKNDKYKEKTIKNKRSYSAKITTKWPYDGITVSFLNKKTGETQDLAFVKYYDMRYATAG